MPHSASHSPSLPADRLGAVGRVLIAALNRGETTHCAIEQQIGAELASGTNASPGLLSTWAAVVYFRAATAAARSAEARRPPGGPPARRGSKKGRPPKPGRGDAALAAQAVNRLRLNQWSRRRELVQREHHTFRGSTMARALLAEALASLPSSPEDSGRWAELAGVAVGIDSRHYCESDAEQAELGLRSEIYQANALRCEGSFDEAEGALRRAIVEAREMDLRDPTFWAEVK